MPRSLRIGVWRMEDVEPPATGTFFGGSHPCQVPRAGLGLRHWKKENPCQHLDPCLEMDFRSDRFIMGESLSLSQH